MLRPGDAVTGWAALHWMGGGWFSGLASDGVTPLDVCLGSNVHRREQPGYVVSQEFIRPGEVIVVDALPVTIPVRSVCFEMRYAASWWRGVAALDMAAYSDLVSIDEAARYVEALGPWTGVPLARKALPHADENSWSPPEVTMRLEWTLVAERPRPRCNTPVFDRNGHHVGTPDLIDPVAGVLGQYDGALHLVGQQRASDVAQEAAYRALGLECVTMLAGDLHDSSGFLRRLDQAYRRAAGRAGSARRWTTTPPSWWIPTDTVARRRALDDRERGRLLRYRRPA